MNLRHRGRTHRLVSIWAFAAVVTALAGVSAATVPAPAATRAADPWRPAGPDASGRRTPAIGAHPYAVRAQRATSPAGQVLFDCQTPAGDVSGLHCYGPDQIRAAYRIQPLLAHDVTGKGRTIVLLEAYAPPDVAYDLQVFDAVWGLPDPELQVLAPEGAPPFDVTDPAQAVWAAETALDTQWAHVVAPAAKIVVVEARSTLDPDVLAALKYTVERNLGDVISMSFGEAESCVKPSVEFAQHLLFARAAANGITLVAGAGDAGAAQATCDASTYTKAVASPASDPDVLSVGGTSLTADPVAGTYGSEKVWNESALGAGAGGGGYSTVYGRPAYQRGMVPGSRRGLPDVAYNAGVDGGVIGFVSGYQPGPGGFYVFGGTSAGAPQWAGLGALAGQLAGHRVGQLNTALYALAGRGGRSALHDVTVGDNGFAGVDAGGVSFSVPGYRATAGWDAASGLGTPVADRLVPLLALIRH